jgi:undecaprenyl-diphosphatase
VGPGEGSAAAAGQEAGEVPAPIPALQAIALGAVQGPTEMLPVSSSAHLSLIPWLADWGWEGHDPELRKSFEVALHAGAAAALLIGQRRVIAEELTSFDRRKAEVIALSALPAVAAGLTLERRIERHLGGPLATAIGLLAGAAAMALADRRPQRRPRDRAGVADGLALGLAQAMALAPGVSRNGATLTAARLRGFTRPHANMLSRTVALPVIVGAAALKGWRLRGRGLPPGQRAAFVTGTAASFGSTLASQPLIRLVERDSGLWPYAAYRAGLAALVLARLQRERRRARAQAAATIVVGNGRPTRDAGAAAARAAETAAGAQGPGE